MTRDPEPLGADSGNVSHPRAVSRNAACCNCGSAGASLAASLPSTWVCACSVSHVSRHCAYDSAGQPKDMTERYPPAVNRSTSRPHHRQPASGTRPRRNELHADGHLAELRYPRKRSTDNHANRRRMHKSKARSSACADGSSPRIDLDDYAVACSRGGHSDVALSNPQAPPG